MNDFFERYARQSHESGAAKTFLAIDNADNKSILGFCSLAPSALANADTPEMIRSGLARHDAPGFRLAPCHGSALAEPRNRRQTSRPSRAACALPLRSAALCSLLMRRMIARPACTPVTALCL